MHCLFDPHSIAANERKLDGQALVLPSRPAVLQGIHLVPTTHCVGVVPQLESTPAESADEVPLSTVQTSAATYCRMPMAQLAGSCQVSVALQKDLPEHSRLSLQLLQHQPAQRPG